MSKPEELRAEITKVKLRLDKYVAKAEARLAELHWELKKHCDHQDTSEYKWEWDSGHGHQKMIVGLRCGYCGSKKAWASSGYWTPGK